MITRRIHWRYKFYDFIFFIMFIGLTNLGLIYTGLKNDYNDLKTEYEKQNNEYNTLKMANDSLQAELYPLYIEMNRYEIALKLYKLKNPEGAKEFEDIKSSETE